MRKEKAFEKKKKQVAVPAGKKKSDKNAEASSDSKPKPRHVNIHTSKSIDEPNSKFPWLTNYECGVLGRGGYFDTEGVLHNEEGCIRCTSIIKSVGKRCKNFAVPGELYCHIHGGTLSRARNGKSRLYSAFIENPTLRAVYENSGDTDNKELAGIKEELGLLRSLLASVVQRFGDDITPGDLKAISAVIGEVRQLVGDCTKAEIRLGQLISIGQVVNVVKQLATIIRKYITDEEVIKQIAAEFDSVVWPAPLATTPQFEREQPVRSVRELSGEVRD